VTRPYSGSIRKPVGGRRYRSLSLWTSGLASIRVVFAVWLISKPDGWEIRAGALPYLLKDRNAARGHVGRDKARRLMRELENAGYLVRARTQDRNGRWVWRSVFTASSVTIDALAVDGSSVDGSSVDGKGVDLYQTQNYVRRIQSISNQSTSGTTREVVGPTQATVFPAVLSGANQASARALINACRSEQRQAVLDEVAGTPRSPCDKR